MKRKKLTILYFFTAAIVYFFMSTPQVYAATITVSQFTDTTSDDGYCSLREAISAANNDTVSGITTGECTAGSGTDTIQVPVGIYTISNSTGDDLNGGGDFDILSNLTITGQGASASDTVIDANNTDRNFEIRNGATATINTITIKNGNSTMKSGGIEVSYDSTLTLNNVNITANTSSDKGGSIYVESQGPQLGNVTINNSFITNNSATNDGGGIYADGNITLNNTSVTNNSGSKGGGIYGNASVTITGSTISNNTASNQGGGLYLNAIEAGATITITNSTLDSNTATSDGGGITHTNGPMTISKTTFSNNSGNSNNNSSQLGGAIYNYGGAITLYNNTFSGNSIGAGKGGGLALSNGTSILYNNTIANNTADTGGGIYQQIAANLTIKNNIIANNTATGGNGPDIFADVSSSQKNLIKNTSDAFHLDASDITGSDPVLDTLKLISPGTTKTLALLAGSPAIDAGDSTTCADATTVNNLDQRGSSRPSGAQCDIGAFEYSTLTTANIGLALSDGQTVVTQGQALTYTATITNNSGSTVNNILVSDTFPTSLTGISWTCSITTGVGTCGTPGPSSGDISGASLNLNSGAVATFTITGTVNTNVISTLIHTLTITMPSGYTNSNSNNNTVSDSNQVKPTLTLVTSVTTPTNNTTPTYVFSSTENGTISFGGSCTSGTTTAYPGNNSITFSTLTDGTYLNCTIIVTDNGTNISNTLTVNSFSIDATAPTIAEVNQVVLSNVLPYNPSYTFSSNEAGSITYGGSCSSSTSNAINGNNTISFNRLAVGTYTNCTIQVSDSLNNASSILTISSFQINQPVSTGGGGGSNFSPYFPQGIKIFVPSSPQLQPHTENKSDPQKFSFGSKYLRRADAIIYLLEVFKLHDSKKDYCKTMKLEVISASSAQYLCQAINLGILHGYNSQKNTAGLLPRKFLSRAEFLAFLERTLTAVGKETYFPRNKSYNDVPTYSWYRKYALFAKHYDLFKGSNLRPNAFMSLDEVKTIFDQLHKAQVIP